jgi:putative membrane protein
MSKTIALFGLIALAGCSHEKRTVSTTPPVTTTPAPRTAQTPANLQVDRDFIEEAVSGGMFEVESGRLALSRTAPDEVTEMAQTIIRDHSQANQKLMEIAREKSVTVRDEMSSEHTSILDRLRNASEEDFPMMFHDVQMQAHQDTIALFERCAKYCQDLEVRQYAAETLPALRQHLQHIHGMQATLRQEQTRRVNPTNPEERQMEMPEEPTVED